MWSRRVVLASAALLVLAWGGTAQAQAVKKALLPVGEGAGFGRVILCYDEEEDMTQFQVNVYRLGPNTTYSVWLVNEDFEMPDNGLGDEAGELLGTLTTNVMGMGYLHGQREGDQTDSKVLVASEDGSVIVLASGAQARSVPPGQLIREMIQNKIQKNKPKRP